MKWSEVEIRKWARIISDDYMHYSDEDFEYIVSIWKYIDAEILPDDSGVIGYTIIKDFDCKKRMNVVILYCKPEKRGLYLRYIMRRIEEIAKQEGCIDIIIGRSVSGYKEEKYAKMLEYFGYTPNGYSKRI